MSGRRGREEKKNTLRPHYGTKGEPFRGTTQIHAVRRALEAPVTEGGPAVSPRQLPGEPNGASQTGFQPVAHPLLVKRDRYFPVHRE